jgi:glycosyltransferase involved in cell wall biosynthesis
MLKRARVVQDSSRTRVLLFDHVATLSGGEIALFNLISHLDRNQFDPVVLLGEEGPLATKLRPFVEVHILPMHDDISRARKDSLGRSSLMKVKVAYFIAVYIRRLARFLRTQKIEIVHSNSLKSDVLAGFACRITRTPLIWHVRDRIAEDYLPSVVAKIFRRLTRWVPDYVIANSHATADTLAWGRPSDYESRRINVIHDGTDTAKFAPCAERCTEGRSVVGIVGRISPWKGQDVFLRAAYQVIQKHPTTRFRIIGSAMFGETQYEADLRRICSELELQNAVEFTGFCEDTASAICELDVLVHASTCPEPFGQVIIEGMAAGKPVIASRAGGVMEIVEHGRTGLLVEMGDANGVANAISQLLSDPAAAGKLAKQGRERILEHFTIQRTAREVSDLYLHVCAEWNG